MVKTVELKVKIIPDFSDMDKGIQKRKSASVSVGGSSTSSGAKSSTQDAGKQVGAVVGDAVGDSLTAAAGPIGLAVGVASGTIIGQQLSGIFDQIMNILNQSLVFQKSLQVATKIIAVGVRFLGDIIGGYILYVFKALLPVVKVLNALFKPFYTNMLKGLAQIYKSTDDPLQRILQSTLLMGQTLGALFSILFEGVVAMLLKAIVDKLIKIAQVLVVTLGGLLILLIRVLTLGLATLIKAFPGGEGPAKAISDVGNQIADNAGTSLALLVGTLEVLNDTAQMAIDQGLQNYIDSTLNAQDAVINATSATDAWGVTLSAIATAFDPNFGQKIQVVMKAVSDAAEIAKKLVSTDSITISDAFTAMLGAMTDSLGIKVPILEDSWQKMLDRFQKMVDDALRKAAQSGSSSSSGSTRTTPSVLTEHAEGFQFLTGAGTPSSDTRPGGGIDLSPPQQKNIFDLVVDAVHQAGNLVSGNKVHNDFIMRPGQAPVSFSGNDTISGVKGGGSSSGGGVNISINISGNGDKQLVDLVRKTVEQAMREKNLAGYMLR